MSAEHPEFNLPKEISKSDLEPVPIGLGETEVVLQRHGKYERSIESTNVGSLSEEGREDVEALAGSFFEQLFESIPESERKNLDILLLASDTQYRGGGRRSMETADHVMEAAKEKIEKYGLGGNQLLNATGRFHGDGGTRPEPKLREPQMIENSPEFLDFLKSKYGDMGRDFWIAFEEDREKEAREQMGAEGPDQIADRLSTVVETLSRFSRFHHDKNPGRRLLIWAVTHYDTISPYTKREILRTTKEAPLGVDYGAGIVIKIDEKGERKVQLSGDEYTVPKRKRENETKASDNSV